ncbi:MAG: hypothetical protein HY698_22755 [Deltaproteobacteria bacterium]|nr:hypothetical protein [Deltaproteobacteria bacterium]
MIRLIDLLERPPQGLEQVVPYEKGALKTLRDHASVATALCESVYSNSTDPSAYEAAILVGPGAASWATDIASLAPGVRHVLVLEPDVRMIRTLQVELLEKPRDHKIPLDQIFLANVLSEKGESYSCDAYFELMAFLLQCDMSLETVLLYMHSPPRQADQGLVAAVEDLFFCRSECFLDLLGRLPSLPTEAFLAWADYLGRAGQPFHALKFYYQLRRHVGDEAIARRAIECLLEVDCHEPMETWINATSPNDEVRAALMEELATCTSKVAEERRKTLQTNLTILRERDPDLARRVETHVPSTQILAAREQRQPWLAGQWQNLSADYWILFRIQGDRLIELNTTGSPRVMRDALWPKSQSRKTVASVLVGNAARYDVPTAIGRFRATVYPEDRYTVVYVVDESLDAFCAALSVVNLTNALADKQVHWCIGEGAALRLDQLLMNRGDLPVPEVHVEVSQPLKEMFGHRLNCRRKLCLLRARRQPPDHAGV